MQREKVKVEKRATVGKAVKKLRREGTLPGNVYGKDMKSEAVQLSTQAFLSLYKKVHETGLIDLELDGKALPVLIHNVHWNPKLQEPLHADFFKVNLREKITSLIPIVAVGEPIAVKDKKGLLLQEVSEIEIEALPADLPEKFEINVESLAEVDDQILVEALTIPSGVTVLTDPAQVLFKIGELVTQEAEEEAAADEAAAEEAKEESSAEEGTPTEAEETPQGEQSEKSE